MKKFSDNFIQLIKLLSDGKSHDGTSIGKKLNITRTAVWKMIKKLEGYDIPVHSVKGKGYALSEPLILLNAKKIKELTTLKSYEIEVFESLPSTNDYFEPLCQGQKIRICLAETQTQGRGRFHRPWHSPFGQNIYFSLLYPFTKDIGELGGLSLAVGLSVCHVVEKNTTLKHPVNIKWPNDVLYDNKKLAGILIDIHAESHGYSYAIIGIGINVNIINDEEKVISQGWTSLRELDNQYHDRNVICASLIDKLLLTIQEFEKTGLTSFLDEWKLRHSLYGKTITLKSGNHQFTGKCLGINPAGHLTLETEAGKIRHFSSGDASILKKNLEK